MMTIEVPAEIGIMTGEMIEIETTMIGITAAVEIATEMTMNTTAIGRVTMIGGT